MQKNFTPLLFVPMTLLTIAILFSAGAVSAQSVSINSDATLADTSAMLDIKSTAKGLLIPRLSTAQRQAIHSPATGLLVYDSTTARFWFYNGTSWTQLTTGMDGWAIGGNTGTNPSRNFIGTTDTSTLVFQVGSVIAGSVERGITDNTSFGSHTFQLYPHSKFNSAFGAYTMAKVDSGEANTAMGFGALYNCAKGYYNTAVGSTVLFANTTGFSNTAIGLDAVTNNVSGNYNTAVGGFSMESNITGSNLTVLGYSAQVSKDSLQNATAIGANATVSASNTIQLGDNNVTAVNSYGTFNTISDGRFKFNIREDVKGLDFILKLRPVTYQLDTRKIRTSLYTGSSQVIYNASAFADDPSYMAIRRTGFIAQEVEQAAQATGFDFDGIKRPADNKDHYSLSYQEFVVPLVKAIQQQQQQIAELQRQVANMQQLTRALLHKKNQ